MRPACGLSADCPLAFPVLLRRHDHSGTEGEDAAKGMTKQRKTTRLVVGTVALGATFAVLGVTAYAQGFAVVSSWGAAAGRLYTAPAETRVGIGISTPAAALQVNSQDDAGLGANVGAVMIGRNTGSYQNLLLDGNEIMARIGTEAGIFYLNHQGGDVVVHGGGTSSQVFRIYEDGRVRIGAANSGHTNAKLSVDGKIVAKEVRVLLEGFPDYVFAEDYVLPSLDSVAAHIAAHKHLPYLPSAAKVEAEGASLGELNMALLRTVEELTLHMIEQSKMIKEQQQVLSRLTGAAK